MNDSTPTRAGSSVREPRISRAAYEALRTSVLGVRESLGLDTVEATFAQAASWAVWADPSSGGGGSGGSTDWSRDMSAVASYEVLAPFIHPDVVFVALNKGVSPVDVREADWATFHSGRRDYMLADAVRHGGMDVFWGAYMTDFYKGLPTRSGAELEAFLDAAVTPSREAVEDAMANLLERELTLLGATDPVLVCLGAPAFEVVSRMLPGRRAMRLTHYAASISKAAYRTEVAGLAECIRRDRA